MILDWFRGIQTEDDLTPEKYNGVWNNLVSWWNDHDRGIRAWTNLNATNATIANLTATSIISSSLIIKQAPVLVTNTGAADSTTSTSFTNTSLGSNITISSGSRVLILFSGIGQIGTGGTAFYTIARGSTDLSVGSGFAETETVGKNETISMVYIDSPGTSGLVTYHIQFKVNNAANTAFFGDTNVTRSIVLIETI